MGTSKKKIYFWNMAGSVCNAFASVLYLAIITRTLDDTRGDIFSIGFAIAQLMFTIASFQVRVFQSTDVSNDYEFTDYFVFRLTTSAIMLICVLFYLGYKNYDDEKAWVMLLLCIFRMNGAFSDVFEGLFQKNERLDIAGKLLTYNTVLCMIGFGITLLVTKDLIAGCVILVVISFLVVIIYGYTYSKRFERIKFNGYKISKYFNVCKSLFIKCLPVFINGFLILFIFNIPKNSIDKAIELSILPDGYQANYSILFMPANAINLLFIFFRPQITSMAFLFSDKKFKDMEKIIRKLVAYLCVFSIIVCIGGYLIGVQVLGVIYGKDVNEFRYQMVLLLFAGGFSTISTLFDNVLTLMRKQIFSTISYVVSIVSVVFISDYFVQNYYMTGAAIVFMVSMIVLLLSEMVVLFYNLKKEKGKRCNEV